MTFRTNLFAGAAMLLLAACGGAETGSEPEVQEVTETTPAEILSATVLTGDDANHYTLSWETDIDGAAVRVEVATDPDFVPGTGEVIGEYADMTTAEWRADGDAERRYFAFTPEGGEPVRAAVRLLPLEGGRNFRDLGGYATEDGKTVKWGHAFRSGVMHELTSNDYDYLSGIGVKVICDFRESDERLREPTEWRAGEAEYLTFTDADERDASEDPMFAALMSPTSTAEDVAAGMAAGYVEIAKREAAGYTEMFDRLAVGDIPLAFNCSAGKDRAGTAAALLLTALGVPRDTVVHDYSLSDDYVDYMATFLNEERREEAANDPNNPYAFLFQLPPEKVAPLLESRPMYIEATLTALDEEFGSVMTFIQTELDVTDSELSAIRAALLE